MISAAEVPQHLQEVEGARDWMGGRALNKWVSYMHCKTCAMYQACSIFVLIILRGKP